MKSMRLPSTLSCLLSVNLISGHLLTNDRTTRMPRRGDQEKGRIRDREQRSVSSQGNHECQEGNPPGVSYSGTTSVTASGRACQVWAATQPHHTDYPELGEHNYCRNPDGDDTGVWCRTTDPDEPWEYCDVKRCGARLVSSQGNHECQEGNPLGATYSGRTNVTTSGRTWVASQPHRTDFPELQESRWGS